MIKSVVIIFTLFVGVCIGFWFGVENVCVEDAVIPTKITFDKLALIASWIGSVGTILALSFAIFAFSKWRSQILEHAIINASLDILKFNISVKNDLSILICNYSNEIENEKSIARLKGDIDNLETKIEVLYTLTHGKKDQLTWSTVAYFKVDDFLKETKELKELAFAFYLLFSKGAANHIDNNLELGFAYSAMPELKRLLDSINISEDPLNAIIPIYKLNAQIDILLKNANSKISHCL